jgi:4-alpha-glucanotransferase
LFFAQLQHRIPIQCTALRRAAEQLQGAIGVIGDLAVGALLEQAAHRQLFVDGPRLHAQATRLDGAQQAWPGD